MKNLVWKLKNVWNTPVPLLETRREKWFFVLFFTLFVPAFLLIFQPFGVNNYDPTHEIKLVFLLASLGFGLVCGLTLALYEFFLAPLLFKADKLLFFVLRIALGVLLVSGTIFCFYNFLGNFHDWNLVSFLGFIRDVSFMALLPLGIIILYFSYRTTRLEYQNLKIRPLAKPAHRLVWFTEGTAGKKIAIALNDLLYVEAHDNYAAIYHLENDQIKKSLIRATMKKLQEQLKAEGVRRCHRSYLINLTQVIRVERNSNAQYQVQLNLVDEPIPVSRSYSTILQALLDTRHK